MLYTSCYTGSFLDNQLHMYAVYKNKYLFVCDWRILYTTYPTFKMPTVAASSIKICLLFNMYHIASSPLLSLCFVSKLILLLLFLHTACPVLQTYRFSQGVTSDFLVMGMLEEFWGVRLMFSIAG